MNTATVETTIQNTAKVTPQVIVEGQFGNGRYSALMAECFKDAQRIFKLTPNQADKLSRKIATDFGSALANAPVEVKRIKSVSKDGKVTLAEAAKVKGITITLALTALRSMQFVNEANKFGINHLSTKWEADDQLSEYFESL